MFLQRSTKEKNLKVKQLYTQDKKFDFPWNYAWRNEMVVLQVKVLKLTPAHLTLKI